MWLLSALQLIDPNKTHLPKTPANNETLQKLLTDFFVIIGALALLMAVIAGTRYILARGNTEIVTSARNQLFYSLIGLVLAALAATIVNFILGQVG
jgi:cytochrome bd-type quinol oxidase subunit 2